MGNIEGQGIQNFVTLHSISESNHLLSTLSSPTSKPNCLSTTQQIYSIIQPLKKQLYSQDVLLRKCANALSVSLSYMSKASATLLDENPISRKRV